jgi:hypothetical protein
METIDIWVFPDTPNCHEVARIVGNDRRARLIDAKQFRDYLPQELTKVPGFVFKARDGKRYPWEGDKCVEYVRLHFGNPSQNLVGSLAGVPVQDVRDRPQTRQQYPPQQQQYPPQQQQYPPQQQQFPPQQQQYPPQQQQYPPQQQIPAPRQNNAGSFGNRGFASLMQGQVRGGSVIAIDEGRMGISGGRAPDIMAERQQQDSMYLPKR